MVEATKASEKIVDIMSNNRILPADWRFFIPILIVQQSRPIVANARNFADGILMAIEKYGIEIPDYTWASHEHSKDYQLAMDWEQ